ncbi:hypothetical protein ARMSODRAFT_1005987 [Armillaria solidipes]|uniref:Uncharacterized protein n=1 Tax=Armillaria solidipes TaxID=1076256 RepID=A0A2H3B6P7_9AGAR|nr:hypothetical protein ARMSODRAFT_1005987 [Armillaria solidipes]
MGPSSAADAALFLEIVCCIALARCLRFVVSMGPSSAAPAAALFLLDGGVLDSVLAFFWFRSIGPAVPAAVLFFEIVCCNIARPWCLRLVSVIPALPVLTWMAKTRARRGWQAREDEKDGDEVKVEALKTTPSRTVTTNGSCPRRVDPPLDPTALAVADD